MRLPRIALSLAFAALAVSCHSKKELTEVRVMTWNVDVGFDVEPIFLTTTLLDAMKAAEVAWGEMNQTNFDFRAKKIAAEIAAAQPDIVGLQEMAEFFSQTPPDGPPPPYGPGSPASTPAKNFKELLLAELALLHQDYVLATDPADATNGAYVVNADVEVTGATAAGAPTSDYRVVDHEAVLVRSGTIHVSAVRKGNYAAHIEVPVPGLPTPFPYHRGWVAVDAVKDGKAFTFFSTHLDAFDPRVQAAQARELLALASSASPTLVVGDGNSDPRDAAWPSYGILVSPTTGFSDTAAEVGAGGAPTCCYDPVTDPNATLPRRVDLVLHSPHFAAESVALHGAQRSDFISSPIASWPSDHVGVSAVLGLE
jgi:endonuclease/exonuclease/phosphatase family metal-dependent hydrolase